MYQIIRNVIESKNYNLADLLKKIDTMWLQSEITDDEKNELIKLARENAIYENSIDIIKKLNEIEERLRILEGGEHAKEYPQYVQGKWYYNGDKITFNGENYICIAPKGQVCTWSPQEYPTYWQKEA